MDSMLFKKKSYQFRIIQHYESLWKQKAKMYLFHKGPIEKLSIDFRILEFPPSQTRNMWTYATCCLSSEEDNQPIELHIFSEKQDTSIVELLTAVAYYHKNGAKLGLHHTINFGRPWQENSEISYGFISLPYLDGPDLENMKNSSNSTTKFYWLIPIYEEEAQYKSKFGAESLEEKFENIKFNYLNPDRGIVV